MRQRYKPGADDFIKKHNQLVLASPEQYKGRWHELFNNQHPIHLEIGTGKGLFISRMAKQYPNVNFIGVELSKGVVVSAAEKVLMSDALNVVLLNENAMNLNRLFEEAEIATIYLNFPDPWPKNRHKKRRLTYDTFLKQYRHILDPGGEIVFKTDNRLLFEYSLVSFSEFGMRLIEVNINLHAASDPLPVTTEYEEKFRSRGQSIYRCRATFYK